MAAARSAALADQERRAEPAFSVLLHRAFLDASRAPRLGVGHGNLARHAASLGLFPRGRLHHVYVLLHLFLFLLLPLLLLLHLLLLLLLHLLLLHPVLLQHQAAAFSTVSHFETSDAAHAAPSTINQLLIYFAAPLRTQEE